MENSLGLKPDIYQDITRALNFLHAKFPALRALTFEAQEFTGNSTGILATPSMSRIYINVEAFNALDVDAYVREWHGLVVDPTPYGVIIHECGHVMDKLLLRKLGAKKYNAFWEKHLVHPSAPSNAYTTPYGQENQSEAAAETFALYVRNKPLPSAFGRTQLDTAHAVWSEALSTLKQPLLY